MSESPSFLIARNPDPESRLPYLVRLPLGAGLVLKVRDTWPRTSRVFCARLDEGWPDGAEVLEEVPILLCRRRGVAVDLVLDRPRENRSQFVFTTLPGGREGIFWQTRKVVGTARPGARIPTRRVAEAAALEIVVDTREHYPYRFARQRTATSRGALPAGDYAVIDTDGAALAVVERKTPEDLSSSLSNGTLVFELAKLAEAPRAALVVEGRYSSLVKHPYAPEGFLPDMLARIQVRYPEIPIVFAETRPLAEEWTYRYLAAARAELAGSGGEAELTLPVASATPPPSASPRGSAARSSRDRTAPGSRRRRC